jgi:hypothetical protein
MNTTAVRIIKCISATELYRRYDNQSEAQPAYIELDLHQGVLLADYNPEVGNALPDTVRHGFDRRYGIPILTAAAANRTMAELAPLAERILADWEQDFDGNNMVARLGEDARAAEAEIEEKLGLNLGYGDAENQGFDEADIVAEWDIDGATNGGEAEEYGITADTTDDRLDDIEAEIAKDMAGIGASDVAVVHGLNTYLRDMRDHLADESSYDI